MCTIDKIKNSVCKLLWAWQFGMFLKFITDTGDEMNVEIVEIKLWLWSKVFC